MLCEYLHYFLLVSSRNSVAQDIATPFSRFWNIPRTQPVTSSGEKFRGYNAAMGLNSMLDLTGSGTECQAAARAQYDHSVQCKHSENTSTLECFKIHVL